MNHLKELSTHARHIGNGSIVSRHDWEEFCKPDIQDFDFIKH